MPEHDGHVCETSRLLDSIIENNPYSMWIAGSDGVLLRLNQACREMFQVADNEVVGKYCILQDPAIEEQGFMPAIRTVFEEGEKTSFVVDYDTSKLTHLNLREHIHKTIKLTAAPVMEQPGKITHVIFIHEDITHEQELEAQINQSQKMAAIGHFAHKITHEFTNALVLIMGNAELAKRKVVDSTEVSHFLNEIIDATNRISSLAASLLAFASPMPPSLVNTTLERVIRGARSVIDDIVLPPQVKMHVEIAPDIGKLRIDPAQIEQVLVLIVINAIEAMPEGGDLLIEARLPTPAEHAMILKRIGKAGKTLVANRFAALCVTDTGHGIPPDIRMRIFEPFFSTRGDKKHPGLGLSTVYSIVERHGGCITVESKPGHGATFKVFLPLAMEHARQAS